MHSADSRASVGREKTATKALYGSLTFLAAENGGYSRDPCAGIHPQIRLGAVAPYCMVMPVNGDSHFVRGREYDVCILFGYWTSYQHLLIPGMALEICDGRGVVARGRLACS